MTLFALISYYNSRFAAAENQTCQQKQIKLVQKIVHCSYWKVWSCFSLQLQMSLKANISVIVHIHDFKNLALPHKARYALQVHLYQGKTAKNPAMPFNILQTPTKSKHNVSKQGYIDDQYFRSKRFNIEYQDQDIQLDDCCEFRFSLQSFPQMDDKHVYIEFMLVQNSLCYFRQDIQEAVEFKEAERYRFKLENLQTGIIRFCEGEFSHTFISSFTFSLFLMVTDYRFHPYTNHTGSDSNKQKAREAADSLTSLMDWGHKYIKTCQNPSSYFYQHYVKNLRYNSLWLKSQVNDLMKEGKQQVILRIPANEQGQLTTVSEKDFYDYITNYQPLTVTEDSLKRDIYRINQENFYFVQQVAKYMANHLLQKQNMRDRFINQKKDLFGERVFKSVAFGTGIQQKEENQKIAIKMRKKKKITELKIIDEYLFTKKQNQHYAFFEVNLPHSLETKDFEQNSNDQVLKQLSQLSLSQPKQKLQYDQRNMMIIFCHGFQASSFDMQMLKREIGKMLPVAHILNSISNQMNTEIDINIMGIKLADQIKEYVGKNFDETTEVILNFVGHSMGGIIARAALPFLDKFKDQMGFFFSLSSPHLGYLNGVDTMIKAGLWVMRKTNSILSLDQLAMEDTSHLRNTFLFKLSEGGHLRNFKKIIFLSSSQDSYVPWHSARVSYYDGNNSRCKIEREMVDNILGEKIVHRVDIHFDIDSTKDLDSFIGRTAHINLLTQQCIMKLINNAIPNLFDLKQL